MGDHLDDCAGETREVEGHESEQDEAHVADGGVADDELEVALHEGDERAVDDADDGEDGEEVAPGSPRSEAQWEKCHGDAEAAVGAELHDDPGEEHGGGGGSGDVSGG